MILCILYVFVKLLSLSNVMVVMLSHGSLAFDDQTHVDVKKSGLDRPIALLSIYQWYPRQLVETCPEEDYNAGSFNLQNI